MRLVPVLLAALAACAGGAPPATLAPVPTPAAASPYDACDGSPEFIRCARGVEAGLLAASGGGVSRIADTLRIAVAAGEPVSLASDTTEGDAFIVYLYDHALAAEGQHLVAYLLYEGSGYLMVDARSGARTYLASRPVLSPGRTRFAVASADLWAMYQPNLLQVWRFTDGAPVLEWGLDGGESWGASSVVWRSETELEFTRHERAGDLAEERTLRMRLRITPGGVEVRPLGG